MSTASPKARGADAPAEAHTWAELTEYERAEVIARLLRRITASALRGDHLRVLEREEWVCGGALAEAVPTCTQRIMLFGHVRHRHREALLALTRQMRLHAVRDLDTCVTVGLQASDAVPSVLVQPLAPSRHTAGYARWNRVYLAMRCGILRKLRAREEKMRERLRELIQESTGAATPSPSSAGVEAGAAAASDASRRADTLRFYTEEFGQLFTADEATPGSVDTAGKAGKDHHRARPGLLPVSEYMAAANDPRVSLRLLACTVPTVLVAWSARYPECVEWLRRELFDDTHLREIRSATGLSGRYAVLIDKDPWVAFAEAHGGLLPRQPAQRKGFRIDLLRPLPKRAQIVLLNMDEDAAAAQAALDRLRECLGDWASPEVDLVSLWAGAEGLQSEMAAMFNVQTLPFMVEMRPTMPPAQKATSVAKASKAKAAPRRPPGPFITHISCNPVEVSKALYDVPNTPRSDRGAETDVWHALPAAERARLARGCGAWMARKGLPFQFTGTVTRDFVLRDPAATEPWRAVVPIASSHVCVLGHAVTTSDLADLAAELRQLSRLRDFEWGVQIVKSSAPLVSSLDVPTPRRLVKGETACVTCTHCATQLFVATDVHVRCLQCTSAADQRGTLCERCAFELRSHPAHHFLLRIPAGTWRPVLPLLWGPSNVVPLDLYLNQFVANTSSYHYGIYCDRCRSMIRRTRWKCAVCCQYDLCDACARERRGALASKASAPAVGEAASWAHDDATHPMLFVPFSQGSESDKFLRPECVPSLTEWLGSAERCTSD